MVTDWIARPRCRTLQNLLWKLAPQLRDCHPSSLCRTPQAQCSLATETSPMMEAIPTSMLFLLGGRGHRPPEGGLPLSLRDRDRHSLRHTCRGKALGPESAGWNPLISDLLPTHPHAHTALHTAERGARHIFWIKSTPHAA